MGVFRRQWPGVSYGRSEDWHYVGEAGEPAFQNSWDNAGGGEVSMAFRIREGGAVDLEGVVDGSAATLTTMFTLPAGYRPSNKTPGSVVYVNDGTAARLFVAATGAVSIEGPVGSFPYADTIHISGQFFLVPPDTAP